MSKYNHLSNADKKALIKIILNTVKEMGLTRKCARKANYLVMEYCTKHKLNFDKTHTILENWIMLNERLIEDTSKAGGHKI